MNKEIIHEFWSTFDPTGIKQKFDKTVLESSGLKEKTKTDRKSLSVKTKEFKKMTKEMKLEKFGGLIRAYQTGINNLTNRSTNAEKNFSEIFSFFTKIARNNPAGLLKELREKEESGKGSLEGDYLKKNEELRKRVEELEKELDEVINQDVTIRNLQEELERVKNEKSTNVQIGEDIQKELKQLETLRSDLEKSQLENNHLKELLEKERETNKELNSEAIETHEALNKQIEILESDLNTKMRENEKIKLSLDNHSIDVKPDVSFQIEIEQKKEIIENLNGKLKKKEEELNQVQKEVNELKNQNEKIFSDYEILKTDLNSRPTIQDFQEVQNRLKIMEKLEFKITDNEQKENLSIEELLSRKLKKIESELIESKSLLSKKEEKNIELKKQVVLLNEDVTNQKELISKLENEIQNFDSSTLENNEIEEKSESEGENKNSGEQMEGDKKCSVLLKIVTNQRDRYLKRVNELEEENTKIVKQNEQILKNQKKLEKENHRIMKKYSSNTAGRDTVIQINSPTQPFSRYNKLFDENRNFEENNKIENGEREKRKYKNLSPLEKFTRITTGKMMKHKYGRIFILGYIVSLHLLVFLSVYFQRNC